MPTAKELIKTARRAERSVAICLRADLTAQMQELERELLESEAQRRAGGSLNAGTESRQLATAMEELRQEMMQHTMEFRLQAVARNRWTVLVAEHPPRPDNDSDKQLGVNESTFFEAILRECTVNPILDDEDWRMLLDESLSDAQWNQLTNAVWGINCRDVDVPFSAAALQILQTLDIA